MGYVNDTGFSKFTPPEMCTGTTGTFAMAVASNVWSLNKTAGDNTSVIKIPLLLPSSSVDRQGAQLASVDIWWDCSVGANDAVSAALYKLTLPATTVAPTAASVATSYDTAHDTAAERLTLAQHKMTLTLTTPEWVDDDENFYVELTIDAAANSVDKLFGARANYVFRA